MMCAHYTLERYTHVIIIAPRSYTFAYFTLLPPSLPVVGIHLFNTKYHDQNHWIFIPKYWIFLVYNCLVILL